MQYETDIVENLLRNYYSLQAHPDSTFSFYKIDIDNGLVELKKQSDTLYFTIVNVFINGVPIQEQAERDGVNKRQVSRRLHDGLYLLTLLMNGNGYES